MRKRRVLITGAAGNMGSRVAQALSETYDLVLLDRDPRDRAGIVQADLRGYDPRWVRHLGQPRHALGSCSRRKIRKTPR